MSTAIQGTNIRKKNLLEGPQLERDLMLLTININLYAGVTYHFRVRCKLSTGWDDFSSLSADVKVRKEYSIFLFLVTKCDLSHIWCCQVLPLSTLQLSAPTLLSRDASSVTIQWTPPLCEGQQEQEGVVEGYRLRYRAEDSLQWTAVDTVLRNTQVRKKGLVAGVGCYFSVLPVLSNAEDAATFAFSPQSLPLQVTQLSGHMSNLFPKQLVAQDGSRQDTAGEVIKMP